MCQQVRSVLIGQIDCERQIITFIGDGPVDHDVQEKLTVARGKVRAGCIIIGAHYQNPDLSKLPLAKFSMLNCWLCWLRVCMGMSVSCISHLVGT